MDREQHQREQREQEEREQQQREQREQEERERQQREFIRVGVDDDINDLKFYTRTRGESFASELLHRYCSFEKLPTENIFELALAGFSATRFKDIIYCDECLAHITDWEVCDNLLLLHKILSPSCLFVKGYKLTEELITNNSEMVQRCDLSRHN